MNGGVLPLVLLLVTLGLALAPAPPRTGWTGLAAMAASAFILSFAPLGPPAERIVFGGLWLSLIATATSIYLPRRLVDRWMLAASVNAGAWIGALAATSDMRSEMLLALPLGLIMVPARWFTLRNHHIVIKVIASWMIAISALSIVVSLMPTPGYAKDHME